MARGRTIQQGKGPRVSTSFTHTLLARCRCIPPNHCGKLPVLCPGGESGGKVHTSSSHLRLPIHHLSRRAHVYSECTQCPGLGFSLLLLFCITHTVLLGLLRLPCQHNLLGGSGMLGISQLPLKSGVHPGLPTKATGWLTS